MECLFLLLISIRLWTLYIYVIIVFTWHSVCCGVQLQAIRPPSALYVFWIVRIHSSQPAKTAPYDCGLCEIALMARQGLLFIMHPSVRLYKVHWKTFRAVTRAQCANSLDWQSSGSSESHPCLNHTVYFLSVFFLFIHSHIILFCSVSDKGIDVFQWAKCYLSIFSIFIIQEKLKT